MVAKMKEEQKRFLEGYLILVVGVFLYFEYKYLVSRSFWDSLLDSLVTFVICNILIIWMYRQTNGYDTKQNNKSMSDEMKESRIKVTPKVVALTEFVFGSLLILLGAYGLTLLPQLRLIIVIETVLFFTLLLYIAVAIILGPPVEWTTHERVVEPIAIIMTFASLFLVGFLGESGIPVIAILCGIPLTLLSIWHFNSQIQKENGAEGEIYSD